MKSGYFSKLALAIVMVAFALPVFAIDVPALVVRTAMTGEPQSTVQTTIIEIPAEHEAAFLAEIAPKAESLLVAHPAGKRVEIESTNDGRVVVYPLHGEIQIASQTQSRNIASPISVEQARRAGNWVIVSGIGVLSTMLYVTSDVGPATAGSIVAGFLTAVGIRYYPQYLKYISGSGDLARKTAEKLSVKNPAVLQAAATFGSLNGSFLYNFITNGVFKLAFTLGDVGKTMGSAQAITELATISATNLLSTVGWDLALSKATENAASKDLATRERTEVVVRMTSYSGRLFLMAVNPLIFVPATQTVGMTLAAAYGTVGLVAAVKNEKFFDLAQRFVGKIENAKDVTAPLAARLNSLQSELHGIVTRPFRGARAANSCRALFGN